MRNLGLRAFCGLFLLLCLSDVAICQDVNPPTCCSKELIMRNPDPVLPGDFHQASLVVSADASAALGLTRRQFVDRLSEALFPGKEIYWVIPTTRLVAAPAFQTVANMSSVAVIEPGLMAIQERRYYKIPKVQLQAEEMDRLTHLYVTDGQTYLRISFVKGDMFGDE